MTIVYFDSSAFVKVVVEGDGGEVAATLWDGCDAAVSSRLAYPEVRAALAAAGRAHRLDLAEQRRRRGAWGGPARPGRGGGRRPAGPCAKEGGPGVWGEDFWAATRAVEKSSHSTSA